MITSASYPSRRVYRATDSEERKGFQNPATPQPKIGGMVVDQSEVVGRVGLYGQGGVRVARTGYDRARFEAVAMGVQSVWNSRDSNEFAHNTGCLFHSSLF